MPQYLMRIQPTRAAMLSEGPTPEESDAVSRHFYRLKEYMEQGIVILAGRTLNTDPTSFGIIIFNADDETAAWEFVNADPAVSEGVMSAELFPYRVALMNETNVSGK